MRVSVILSTYNAPEWLGKVIWGYAVQSYRDFDLLVADDGSTPETASLLRRLRDQTALKIHHVWHEDRGFRKCTILNKAIELAEGDYLVFSDGDCIPRWDFVGAHVKLARPRCFLSGGAVRLPMALSKRIASDDVIEGRATDPGWLFGHGLRDRKCRLRLFPGPLVPRLLDMVTTTRATWNGCNASTWKSHIVGVNGFDERMGYGGLDRELGERLVNAGVRPIQVRYRAVCVHLDHARAYVRQDTWEANHALRRETRRNRAVWTPYGIRKNRSVPDRRAA
jgi:glycosyltransferase involved in cell wall biosynthesis